MVDVRADRRSQSPHVYQRDVVHNESSSSENFINGGRRQSTVDTAVLLSAILAQLRYITANVRRQCKRAEVKDD